MRIIHMRQLILFTAAVISSCPAIAQSGQTVDAQSQPRAPQRSENQQPASKAVPFPLQLEMRVPFEPTAFPNGARMHLLYELHLTNFANSPLYVSRIDVIDADAPAAEPPIATFQAEQLAAIFQSVGGNTPAGQNGGLAIPNGRTAVVFMYVSFDRGSHTPDRLVHRVMTTDSLATGAEIGTHHTSLHVLGPPLEGPDWLAADGPSNDPGNHHRRGILIIDGRPIISRRYAIDWKQIKDGVSFSGDPLDKQSYYAYGKTILAVADGRVVTARDGLPDNIPGHNQSFHPAVPITLDTVSGNTITIDLGGGQFAYYFHLQPGSLRVKAGDRVRRGQMLARVGCSGDAREPHLHFEVSDSSKVIAGEGLTYVIDHYSANSAGGGSGALRTRELPMNNNLVDFAGSQKK
jgi:murein DD-endopeptidase MepM/ murein hydrolase activator NlpD